MVPNYPKIVKREAGPATCTGAGDIVTDDRGNTYRIVSPGEASMLRNSTAGMVYTIHSDGTVR